MFTLHNRNYLCIVDYHSKFLVMKKMEDLSADSLILKCKIIFLEYCLPKKTMSDSGGNFISDKFKIFCRSLNMKQTFSSSHHHQSNGQVEACLKLINQALKCFDTKSDPCIALLQIRSTQKGQGCQVSYPIRGIIPTINRPLIGVNNDEDHYETLVKRQTKNDKNHDTSRNYALIPIGFTAAVQ